MGETGRHRLLALIRVGCYAAIAALGIYSLVSTSLDDLSAQLVQQKQSDQDRIAQLQATIDELRSRWIGEPALWTPEGLPTGTNMTYFPVTGSSQAELMQAIEDANICVHYGPCLVDPAVPTTGALALELDGSLIPNEQYCYTFGSVRFHFSGHQIVMPQWSPKPGTVSITLVQRWDALEQVFFVHEAGHVRVAEAWLAQENAQSARLSCEAAIRFWDDPHLFDSLDGAQNAYHAQLRADCRPEIGCLPAGYMGWWG